MKYQVRVKRCDVWGKWKYVTKKQFTTHGRRSLFEKREFNSKEQSPCEKCERLFINIDTDVCPYCLKINGMKENKQNNFKPALLSFLKKWGVKLSIEDTEIIDYKNVEGFGNIYKKTIVAEIFTKGQLSKHIDILN